MSSDKTIFKYIAENKKDKVEKLIQENPNILNIVNDENIQWTPLNYATIKNKPDIVKMLLKYSNYDKNLINKKDYTGWAPLAYASAYNNKPIANILLKSGAEITDDVISASFNEDIKRTLKKIKELQPIMPFLEQAYYKDKLSKGKSYKKNKSKDFTKDLTIHLSKFLHFSKRKLSKRNSIKVSIKKSTKADKKLMAIFTIKNDNSKITTKVVHFGAKGYSDYTIHKDPERKQRYINRHKTHEKWSGSVKNLMTAGALSRWILWNKPTLNASIEDYKRKLINY